MSLLPWLALALAAPPNKTARVFSVAGKDSGTDRLGNMQVTDDGRLVSGRTGKTGTGFVLDVDSWRLTTFSDCTVVGVGIAAGFFGLMVLRESTREHEADCDRRALELIDRPEALIDGLRKVYQLGRLPVRMAAATERSASHPPR